MSTPSPPTVEASMKESGEGAAKDPEQESPNEKNEPSPLTSAPDSNPDAPVAEAQAESASWSWPTAAAAAATSSNNNNTKNPTPRKNKIREGVARVFAEIFGGCTDADEGINDEEKAKKSSANQDADSSQQSNNNTNTNTADKESQKPVTNEDYAEGLSSALLDSQQQPPRGDEKSSYDLFPTEDTPQTKNSSASSKEKSQDTNVPATVKNSESHQTDKKHETSQVEKDSSTTKLPTQEVPKKKRKYTKRSSKASAKAQEVPAQGASLHKIIQSRHNQVLQAADLVAQSLHAGPWPSPYRSLDPSAVNQNDDGDNSTSSSSNNNNNNKWQQHVAHMSMVGASLNQFAQDVIVPHILQEMARSPPTVPRRQAGGSKKEVKKKEDFRVFCATLIMLRELLVLNALSIFGPSGMLTGRELDFRSTMVDVEQQRNSSVTEDEVAIFSVRILATTIILTGLGGLENHSEEVTASFLDAVAAYDRGDDEFADCLEPVGSNVRAFFSNRQRMPEQLIPAWKTSCNLQREKHPLVVAQNERRDRKRQRAVLSLTQMNEQEEQATMTPSIASTIRVPEPTAVHISLLETRAEREE